MADSKRKSRTPLTELQRMQALGDKPFDVASDVLTKMVVNVYSKTGEIPHQLLGIDFENGAITGFVAVEIHRKEDVVRMRDHMLKSFPMVVHIFEAWTAPDNSARPSDHPKRQDSIAIMLHIDGAMAAINCAVDPKARTVTPGPMVIPDQVEGNWRRELGPRH